MRQICTPQSNGLAEVNSLQIGALRAARHEGHVMPCLLIGVC
jgi:hypothetical protein